MVVTGNGAGHATRTYVVEMESGKTRPVTPEGSAGHYRFAKR
jgi:hypothetical protein